MDRILGKIEGDKPGPLVICIAGLHAFRNVFSSLQNHNIRFRGKLVGIAGNIHAIQENKRFIDYDLNRCWSQKKIDNVVNHKGDYPHLEDKELLEIYEAIESESTGDFNMKIMADLHATSSEKGNFIVVPEASSNHPVLNALKLPIVVDLDQYLEGTLLDYYYYHNFISFALEGGMVGTSDVYQLHTSGLWEILDKAGCISHHDHEIEDHYTKQLLEVSQDLPKKVKVLHRELIMRGDGFKMLPGFHNFMPVKKGQLLAINNRGEIKCPIDGLIFMPLYQNEGDDGFFIVEDVAFLNKKESILQ